MRRMLERMSRKKHVPDVIRDGHRFSEKDMRQRKNLERIPISIEMGRALVASDHVAADRVGVGCGCGRFVDDRTLPDDDDTIGQHTGAAGDRAAIPAGLADDRRRLAGDRRLVHRRDALDHGPVAGD